MIAWFTKVETIKRQTRATYGCRQKSVNSGLAGGLGCTPVLSVSHSATTAAVCNLWHFISVTPLFWVFWPLFWLTEIILIGNRVWRCHQLLTSKLIFSRNSFSVYRLITPKIIWPVCTNEKVLSVLWTGAQCGWQTKINWTKMAHHIHRYTSQHYRFILGITDVPRGGFKPPQWIFESFVLCVCKIYCPSPALIFIKS